jgi:hypothetical protein
MDKKIPKFYIATYTHEVKDYCSEKFYKNLDDIFYENKEIHVVDNTENEGHLQCIKNKLKKYNSLTNLTVDYLPKHTLFLRRVSFSVNYLREKFLESDADYFFIIESDILVPPTICNLFLDAINIAPTNWGIIGGLYYQGFHYYSGKGLVEVHHALSGCTIYKRDLIEKYPFRWSTDNLGAFPDAWICYDVNKDGIFKIFNYNEIQCQHLHDNTGRRGHHLL